MLERVVEYSEAKRTGSRLLNGLKSGYYPAVIVSDTPQGCEMKVEYGASYGSLFAFHRRKGGSWCPVSSYDGDVLGWAEMLAHWCEYSKDV